MAAAFQKGKHVSLVVDWSRCKYANNEKWDVTTAYETHSAIMNNDGSGLTISGFTYRNELRYNKNSGPVNLAYQYKLQKDGTVDFTQRYIDPVTYVEKAKASEVTCQLGDSFKAFT